VILLLQPRHVYAPPSDVTSVGHIYLPSALLSVASRLRRAGLPISITDENFEVVESFPDFVGINVIGPPYIHAARELQARARRNNSNVRFLIGGQGLNGLSKDQFHRLFGLDATNGNEIASLEATLGIEVGSLPLPESSAMVPAYELIPTERLRAYLSSEFSFYLSQGCRFGCTFCAANRSVSLNGTDLKVRERYRTTESISADLEFLFSAATDFGISRLSLYLTNLDLFQTPIQLRAFAEEVIRTRKKWPHLDIGMRGLSTATSFCSVAAREPELVVLLRHAGLERIGFGVDGATSAVWFLTNKPVAREDVPLQAIMKCRDAFGMTPETLMVFGHNLADDEHSLDLANRFMQDMHSRFGAIPRPHVAKDVVPGNDGWSDIGKQATVDFLMGNPAAFQLLDFTTLPTWLTHPDKQFREIVTRAYLMACALPGAMTQYTLPEDPELPAEDLNKHRAFNLGRYDL
jgi:hypothetical protein